MDSINLIMLVCLITFPACAYIWGYEEGAKSARNEAIRSGKIKISVSRLKTFKVTK